MNGEVQTHLIPVLNIKYNTLK